AQAGGEESDREIRRHCAEDGDDEGDVGKGDAPADLAEHRLSRQPGADTTHRFDQQRSRRILFELLTERAHADPNRARVAQGVVSPDLLDELFGGKDLTGVSRQVKQEIELFRLEGNLGVAAEDATTARLNPQGANRDRLAAVDVIAPKLLPQQIAPPEIRLHP